MVEEENIEEDDEKRLDALQKDIEKDMSGVVEDEADEEEEKEEPEEEPEIAEIDEDDMEMED